ncbi:Argininosuccinate lyase [Variovorax sp. PBS-H4]|uniref:Bug family tripartite tricarboxylate transporter substrate binding protein n=1 Tax=Variovorax sp. PBS-H4 TaxID=434008 RepID=UPI001316E90F|nr:tripartite tricarboxylate transporter substrate-binding protein [Variovorax sp. PBS-H4]VTU33148.1 Argininosuccinate lyase [Variovorax sp. PBS-H4]
MHSAHLTRRRAALLLLAAQTLLPVAMAQTPRFPTAPIRMLVGTPAGGTTDVIGRLVAQKMGENLGQQVVVENKAGAGGLIAAESVAKAAADGYTLLMAPAQLATYRALYPGTTLNPETDLQPLGLVATTPYVMVVHPSLAVKSLPELIAHAKAHPGQVSYAGSTPGGAQHLAWEQIKRSAAVDMQFIPYKGTAALMPDLLAGRLQAGIDNIAVLAPYVKSGQLRGIAVTSAKRTDLLPEVPTVADSGMPNFQAIGWFGVFTTGKVPAAVLSALSGAVEAAVNSPDMRSRLAALGAEPQSGKAEDMRAMLSRETATWTRVIQEAGIKVQ